MGYHFPFHNTGFGRNFTDYNNLHSITFRPCGVQTVFAGNALNYL